MSAAPNPPLTNVAERRDQTPDALGQGGPPIWEQWRGEIPDEDVEFIRVMFEEFTGSW